MSSQSPLISIPKKTTTDVDWTNPIRAIIAHSYGEDPNTYAEECSVLQRCRQDAVRGAGSDQTARDLLYKYFGQLELLELRFAEIKVSFPWNDAFTLKNTTQSSLAFEKASIIYLLSSVLSSLAAGSSRADPEGVKRAYYNSRASAGMLTYINENFLHAPSTDLSREVIHLLTGIMMAQATEIFTEKLIEEKKAPALISRSANQVAGMYNTLLEEMKEFQGKGILDRNWLYLLQIKAKLFGSFAQYYRSIGDGNSGKHGYSLVRMKLADTLAQEALRLANSFTYTFISSSTPSLPPDAATSLQEITKAHASVCGEAKDQAIKDNDLIYHDILPSESSLPNIDKLPPAAPITIQDVYANPDISKLIGPDIFARLIPLAVHESASVYSEEKAKLVRAEVERTELNEGEIRAGLEHLGLPGIVNSWRRLADDDDDDDGESVEVSLTIRRLAADIQRDGPTEPTLRRMEGERQQCERDFQEISGMLDNESRECERARAKYAPQFTQSPGGPHTAHWKSNISTNLGSIQTAANSDQDLLRLWQSIQGDISLLSGGEAALQKIAKEVSAGKQPAGPAPGVSLLDLEDDVGSKTGLDEREKEELRKAAADAQEKLDRMGKVRRERDEVLKDLKEKIQTDDVSSLLLLNRRSQNVEPQLFASELEKFRPYQGRIAAAVQASTSLLQELEMLVKQVEKGKGVRERQRGQKDKNRRLREWERKLEAAGEGYQEVRAGISKGLSYYDSLQGVIADLRREVKGFVSSREAERNRMISEIETRQRLAGSPPAVPAPPSSNRGLDSQMANMSLGGSNQDYGRSSSYNPTSPPPQTASRPSVVYSSGPSLPPPPSKPTTSSFYPPPPSSQPPKPSNPYDFASLGSLPSAFSTSSPTTTTNPYPAPPSRPDQHQQPQAHRQPSYSSAPAYTSPPPQNHHQTSNPYPPPPSSSRPSQPPYQYQPPPSQPAYPAPPQPQQHQQQLYSSPPPSQQGSAQSHYPSQPSQQYGYTSPPAHTSYSSPPPLSQSPYQSYPAPPGQHGRPQQHQQYGQQPPQQQQQPPYAGYSSPPPQQPPQQQSYGGYQNQYYR